MGETAKVLHAVRKDLHEANVLIAQLEAEKAKVQQVNRELEEQVTQLRLRVEAQQKEIDELKTSNAKLTNEANDLDNTLQRIRKLLATH